MLGGYYFLFILIGDQPFNIIGIIMLILFALLLKGSLVTAAEAKPLIVITSTKFRINDKNISLKDILSIAFDGFKRGQFSIPIEVVEVKLKSGELITLKTDNYNNGELFRKVCEKIQENIKRDKYELDGPVLSCKESEPVTFDEIADENFQTFLGNPFTLFKSHIPIISGLVFLTGALDKQTSNSQRPYLFVAGAIALLCTGLFQSYFMVSEKYFVVKNHIYFWKSKVIPIKDIKRFSAEIYGRGAVGVIILTNDFKVHKITTGAMSVNDDLEEMVKVVNDYMKK